MPTQEVIHGRKNLYTSPLLPHFSDDNPTDTYHTHLLTLLTFPSPPTTTWPSLLTSHHALDTPVIPLTPRLSYSPFDTHGAPTPNELSIPGKRFMTLGRILVDRVPTRSFWVVHEVRGRVFVGVWRRGWVDNMLGFGRALERAWREGGRGNVEGWSSNINIGDIPDDLIGSLETELLPEEKQPKPDYIEIYDDPLTPPQTPSLVSSNTTTTLKLLSREEYDTMSPSEQTEYRQRVEQEKKQIEAELELLNQNSYAPPLLEKVKFGVSEIDAEDEVEGGVDEEVDGKMRELDTMTMSLAESFLARHLSGNMLRYLKGIERGTVEGCRVSDRALDEVVGKRFRAL